MSVIFKFARPPVIAGAVAGPILRVTELRTGIQDDCAAALFEYREPFRKHERDAALCRVPTTDEHVWNVEPALEIVRDQGVRPSALCCCPHIALL
jgi:hypothetical protein